MTKYGKCIQQCVLSSCDHPTAEEIYLRLHEQGWKLSKATVYNNLKALVEEGELRRVTLENSPDRYDSPAPHQHLCCVKCGKLTDVQLRDLSGLIREDIGVEALCYDLRIGYLCPDCRKKEENGQTAE